MDVAEIKFVGVASWKSERLLRASRMDKYGLPLSAGHEKTSPERVLLAEVWGCVCGAVDGVVVDVVECGWDVCTLVVLGECGSVLGRISAVQLSAEECEEEVSGACELEYVAEDVCSEEARGIYVLEDSLEVSRTDDVYSSAVDVDDSIEELCTAYTSSLEEDASVVSGVVASGIVIEVVVGGESDEVVCTSCSHVLVEEEVAS